MTNAWTDDVVAHVHPRRTRTREDSVTLKQDAYPQHVRNVKMLAEIREALAEAIQVAQSGTTGTPPNVDGVTESEALAIMSDALVKVARLIYPSEDS